MIGRPRLDLPPVRAVNCYLEKSPGGPSGEVRTTRPGLFYQYTIGAGPILRTFQRPGVFWGSVFNVSGNSLYRDQTMLGGVAYSRSPRFTAAQTYLALTSGGALYIYNGTTFRAQTTFDDGVSPLPAFGGQVVLYNIWVYFVAGTNEFFFSQVGNPGVINAANYGSAQVSPTPIVEVAVLAEEIYFFKTDTVEIWDFTGALTAPFAESPGRTYARGCAAQGSVALADNSLFWVGDDFTIYRTGTVPQRVSTSFIEDRLNEESNGVNAGAEIVAFNFNLEGHVFYVVSLPDIGETYAYDCQTQQWFQWGTQIPTQTEPAAWIIQTCSGLGNGLWAGSSVDGKVYIIDEEAGKDDTTPIRVVIGGARWIEEGIERANNLALQMVRGIATPATPNPTILMRWSDDGGRTWTSWIPGSLGGIGGYGFKVSWHSLGLIRQPGREFEFAISDDVNVTIESATLNPPRR